MRLTSQRHENEQLIRDHLPLARHLVAEVSSRLPRHVCMDDLAAAAMLGLAQAARSYDATRGIPFGRYAATRVRGAIVDELRSLDWASRSVRARAREFDAAADRLAGQLRRSPTTEELAGELGVSAREVDGVLADVRRATVIAYESLVVEGGGEHVLGPDAGGSPDDVLVDRERRAYLRDAIRHLPERLRYVVNAYFFEERRMQEIAEELGVTESRVSQMRSEALAMLRDGMRATIDADGPADEPSSVKPGRVTMKRSSYYAAIAAASDYRTRITAVPPATTVNSGTG